MTPAGPPAGAALVLGLVLAAGVLFAGGWLPVEVTALAVAVLLALLSPWTGVTPGDAISGFGSPATITVLAMFVLSEGLRRTGVVDRIAGGLLRVTGDSETRRLGATVGIGGTVAGFVNNTPLVAVLIPALVDLARRTRSSPSRLLLPLSYAAMLGGTLTVIGTSVNLLVSDLSGRLLAHPIGIFEMTPGGLVVLGVGLAYLMTAGRRLVPARIPPAADLTEKFGMRAYLHRVGVPADSPLVGRPIGEIENRMSFDLDILRIRRGRRSYFGLTRDREIEAGDALVVRAESEMLQRFAHEWGVRPAAPREITDASLVDANHALVEATVPPGSGLIGESVTSAEFRSRYRGTVLAVNRGHRPIRDRIEERRLRGGDSLLVLVLRKRLAALDRAPELSVTGFSPASPPGAEGEDGAGEGEPGTRKAGVARRKRMPVAVAIMAAVVGAAAAGLTPIYIAALAGVVLMVATGCLRMPEAYEAVDWKVIFLLAGIIPLGIAMSRTGAADLLAGWIVGAAGAVHPVVALGLFYVATALLANVVSSIASVVLMVPVAVDAAVRLGADPFAYVLAVAFAANTAFMSPVGYQTNLMVFTPGGYRFTDFARVGGPLQLLLAVVTPLAIAAIWGL